MLRVAPVFAVILVAFLFGSLFADGAPFPSSDASGADSDLLTEMPDPSACETSTQQTFDFWIGSWSLQWADGRGTNRIQRILGGRVIEETFDGQTPTGRYRGRSWTVYDAEIGIWQQTWVDDQGAFTVFEGTVRDDRMILSRTTTRDGVEVQQRMVWHSIVLDRLVWDWERSTDDGVSWETLWSITYTRSS